MGQIIQLPVAIKMKLDVLFVIFRGKKTCHAMHLCAISIISEGILAVGVSFSLVSNYIYVQDYKFYSENTLFFGYKCLCTLASKTLPFRNVTDRK
jgi:hypothetical protein